MKSFREDCKKIINVQKKGICSNHPHNYYLEILTDLGIENQILIKKTSILDYGGLFFAIFFFKYLKRQ